VLGGSSIKLEVMFNLRIGGQPILTSNLKHLDQTQNLEPVVGRDRETIVFRVAKIPASGIWFMPNPKPQRFQDSEYWN
jgi:hypothetical protein